MSSSPPSRKNNRNLNYEKIYNDWLTAKAAYKESTYIQEKMDHYNVSVGTFWKYICRGKKLVEKNKKVA